MHIKLYKKIAMSFFEIYLFALIAIMTFMSLLWLVSVIQKNASIVDPFWGMLFIIAGVFYAIYTDPMTNRKILVLLLVILWGLRLSIFLGWRNRGKGEDFRYQQFRKDFGPERYWWVSFFQTFLLQGVLAWLISAPLLASMYYTDNRALDWTDYSALGLWIIGFLFEAIGDLQLSRFKANPANKGKVLRSGLWKFTRHPNYFGNAMIWWAFGLFAVASGSYLPLLSSLLMVLLLLKVSGVSLLEKTLKASKPDYHEYMNSTSAFFPWFPKNKKRS